ncbi:MAG: hypothetical protein A2521_14425 [Deltaproteobacteria bacterium RIFOXYD12_FULL_57_12]|nr:MAG: hypothetical protein A2521_14425 [Deltaproteobacteria bacterium RIFOXYD12_FULL_57_12]
MYITGNLYDHQNGEAKLEKTGKQDQDLDAKMIRLLEKQKQELVVRSLRKHEEAQAEKHFTDTLISSLSELFFVMTKDFHIVKTNDEFCRSLGYSQNEARHLRLEQLVEASTMQSVKELIAAGDFKSFQTNLLNKHGETVCVNLNCSTLVTESGRVLHMLIAADKSDVYRMMSRIRESQEQLIHSGRLASLGEMAAGIGHELTQPLNAILLFARNSLKALDNPRKNKAMLTENLNIIVDRVNKASSIIKSLKSFARKTEEHVRPLMVNDIITEILRFLDAQLKLSDIELELNLDSSLPAILGHDVRLEQVFLNLIQNAIQAMGSSLSPRLAIRSFLARDIEPESLQEKDYLVVAIRDNGEGIPHEIQGKIFNPFFTTREVGLGMGLGLSIVDRIVRSHAGYIRVESEPGAGACFAVYLPVLTGEQHEQQK